jgi:hypothetical protein
MGRVGDFRGLAAQGVELVGDGEQQISLGRGCSYKATVLHQIMTVLGWTKEQMRPDREEFITINWNNIPKAYRMYFATKKGSDNLGAPYDHQSVMHYHSTAFAKKRGSAVITSKTSTPILSASQTFDRNGAYEARGLSWYDAYKINKVYSLIDHCAESDRKWAFENEETGNPVVGVELEEIENDVPYDTCGDHEFEEFVKVIEADESDMGSGEGLVTDLNKITTATEGPTGAATTVSATTGPITTGADE